MKFIIAILIALLCSPSLIAAPGGGHHKITEYDYHDYINEDIQSKTFVRYNYGVPFNLVWEFDRSIPGEVLRTETLTDADGNLTRYSTSKYIPRGKSFNQVQYQNFDPYTTPPTLIDTTDIDPPIVVLTDSMISGTAWASGSELNSTYAGVAYNTDKREVVGVESVSVTAGKFSDCLKVHILSRSGFSNQTFSRLDWFCPDIGLVKRISGSGRAMFDLTSVTYNERGD